MTIGNTIYFVRGMNFGDPNDGWTLFHELEHVVQYANRGGVEPFLSEYVLKAAGSILRGGNSIDMHDNIDLENAANAKANQVANAGLGAQANVVAPAILPAPPMGILSDACSGVLASWGGTRRDRLLLRNHVRTGQRSCNSKLNFEPCIQKTELKAGEQSIWRVANILRPTEQRSELSR